MGISKVLIMSFFLKLNLRYDKIFWRQEHQRKAKTNNETVTLNEFFKFQNFCEIQFRIIDFGPMRKSITWNTLSRNSSDMPVDRGETYYTALDEELKYFIIVVLEIQ